LKYEWSLNKQSQEIKELNQRIKVKDQFDIKAKYNHKKYQTKIRIEIGSGKEKEKLEETVSGLVIVKLTTKIGSLNYSY